MIKIKEGVKFDIVAPSGAMILQTIKSCAKFHSCDLTITSGTDGKHSGENDPHHRGEAYDIRSHDLLQKDSVLEYISQQLGSNFYAFIEDRDKLNEHIHIQIRKGLLFDPIKFLTNQEMT
jgi:hypothetical protein